MPLKITITRMVIALAMMTGMAGANQPGNPSASDSPRSSWGYQLRSGLDLLDSELQNSVASRIENPVSSAIAPLFFGTEQYFFRYSENFTRLYLSHELARLKIRIETFEVSQRGRSQAEARAAKLKFIDELRADSQVQVMVNALFLQTTQKISSLYPLGFNDYQYFERVFDLLTSLRSAPHFEVVKDGVFENPRAYLGSEYVDLLESFYRSRIPSPEFILQKYALSFEPVRAEVYRQEAVGQVHFLKDVWVTSRGFSSDLRRGNYVNPTEHNPGAAASILKTAPPGAYVTVGTERGFIGAGQTPSATHLVFLDVSRAATIYNRINIALLQMAKNRQDYLWLRRNAKHRDILARLKVTPPDQQGLNLLRRENIWDWWQGQISRDGFILLHEPPDPTLKDHAFKDANYLHYEDQFQRVSEMAKKGRIASLQVDLGDATTLQNITEAMIQQDVPLAVFDFSDVWYDNKTEIFLSVQKSAEALRILGAAAQKSSLLLLTSWYVKNDRSGEDLRPGVIAEFNQRRDSRFYGGKAVVKAGFFWPWIYFAYTFESISRPGNAEALIKSLNGEFEKNGRVSPRLAGTLNGKLPSPQPSRIEKIFSFLKGATGNAKRSCSQVLN